VFAEVLGIRPWEVGLLDQGDFEVLIDYVEDRNDGH
jgi:hypothetical protein